MPPTPPASPAPAPAPQFSRLVVLVAGDERIEISTTALLGRSPVAPAGMNVGDVVRVMDMSRSVSKTHAMLTWDGQVLSIEDQGSMNGTTVHRPDGTQVRCHPDAPVHAHPGDTLHLGDKVYSVKIPAGGQG